MKEPFELGDIVILTEQTLDHFKGKALTQGHPAMVDRANLEGVQGTVVKVQRQSAWWSIYVNWDNDLCTQLDHASHELVQSCRLNRYALLVE